MEVCFFVPGPPQGKARARTVYNSRAGYTQSFTPQKTVLYENWIKNMYWQECRQMMWGEAEPLALRVTAVYEPPKSTGKRAKARMLAGELLPTKKPDADNIAKVVLDALNGVAYRDDSQVVRLAVEKEYGEEAGLRVRISEIDTGK